jgi:anthranilate phosphoribosyltransferase
VLGALGSERAWVVHGGGLDEMTTTGETSVAECARARCACSRSRRRPSACRAPRSPTSPAARRAERRGAARPAGRREGRLPRHRLLNAAAAFLVGDKVETLREGVELAGAVIDDGRAKAALDKLVEIAGR